MSSKLYTFFSVRLCIDLGARAPCKREVYFAQKRSECYRDWSLCDCSSVRSRQLSIGRTPKGAYSPRGRSRHLLETAFSETPSGNPSQNRFYCKTHSRPPSQNPSENPFPRTLPRTFSEPFLERCVAVRPLRRAPNSRTNLFHADFGKDFPSPLSRGGPSWNCPSPRPVPPLGPQLTGQRKVHSCRLQLETWRPKRPSSDTFHRMRLFYLQLRPFCLRFVFFTYGGGPKGPFRTKNSTESEFRYGEQIRYGRSKTLRRGPRSACFPGKRGRKTVRILKTTAVAK